MTWTGQAEQLAILKALDYIQHMKIEENNSSSTHRQQDNSSVTKKTKKIIHIS
jgi:hypothetical protein